MALADDPIEHIRHMFRMEAHCSGPGHGKIFKDGCAPKWLPLSEGEKIYGVYNSRHYFSPLALYVVEPVSWFEGLLRKPRKYQQIRWNDVVSCSTQYPCGDEVSIVCLRDGTSIKIANSVSQSHLHGKVSQLFHAMINKWGVNAVFGEPHLTVDQFVSQADADDCIAPNLYPHPGVTEMKRRLDSFKQLADINGLKIIVHDRYLGVPDTDSIIFSSTKNIDELAKLACPLEVDSVHLSDANNIRKFGRVRKGSKVLIALWD